MTTWWVVERVSSAKVPYRICIEQNDATVLAVRAQQVWPGATAQVFCLRDREIEAGEAFSLHERGLWPRWRDSVAVSSSRSIAARESVANSHRSREDNSRPRIRSEVLSHRAGHQGTSHEWARRIVDRSRYRHRFFETIPLEVPGIAHGPPQAPGGGYALIADETAATVAAAQKLPEATVVKDPHTLSHRAAGPGRTETQVRVAVLKELPTCFSIVELRDKFPDNLRDRISRLLANLRKEGLVRCTGRGKGARWHRCSGDRHPPSGTGPSG